MFDIVKSKRKEALKDHCGVFGIFAPGEDVAKITYFALHSLQHRGQEAAGISVSNGKIIKSIRKIGLVTSVFNDKNLRSLKGFLAVGHNRYSTTGSNTKNNIQPIIISQNGQSFSVAHNGNIVNAATLAAKLNNKDRISTSDTEVLALTILKNSGKSWGEKILQGMSECMGAYSIVASSNDTLFAFRDPWGFRPLVLGKLNGCFVVASETCALDTIGADYIRDVVPGEVIAINKKRLLKLGKIQRKAMKFCLFEYVYLARPDSLLNNMLVHQARQRSGEILAKEAPVNADLVVAIPDSGTSAALGYARASGIPFGEILIKNRYIGRTFIVPEQHIREQGVKMKFNPMKQMVIGKRIIVVDDSIVRGTTMKQIVEILRNCGVKKIHLRICSPPIRWPCFFGVDTPERRQLIASDKTVDEISKYIGADSLKYLSLEGLIKASGQNKSTLCTSCFSGKYPMKVNMDFKKNIFESTC